MNNTDRIIGSIVVLIACLALVFAVLRVLESHKQQLADLRARITKLEAESITHQRGLAHASWPDGFVVAPEPVTVNLRAK